MIKILNSILFFKIKRRFGWGVATLNLLLDIQICLVAGLFVFTLASALALLLLFLLGNFTEETIHALLIYRTGIAGALVFFFWIFILIESGSFKQTLLMSLGKIPWPEEQPSWFPGRKKELEYRPAPKQWTLAPKQDENKQLQSVLERAPYCPPNWQECITVRLIKTDPQHDRLALRLKA